MYELGGSMLRVGIHDILGIIALLFMTVNAIGSVFVLKKYKNLVYKFYIFSIISWIIWVVSYILGVTTHMWNFELYKNRIRNEGLIIN